MKILVALFLCLPIISSKHVSDHSVRDLNRLLKALADADRMSFGNIESSKIKEDDGNSPADIVAGKEAEDRKSKDDVRAEKAVQNERDFKVKNEEGNIEGTEVERNSHDPDDRVDSDARIIGGSEIEDISKWPWLVSVQSDPTFLGIFGGSGSCTGSLVADRWVLTADHCFDITGPDPDEWKARMGNEDYKDNFLETIASWFGGGPAWEEDAEKIIIHPDYEGNSDAKWKNDIALMKLESAAPLDDEDIGLVTLPPQGDYYFPQDGAMCIAKGWGCTEQGGSSSSVAKIVEMPKISDSRCSSLWNLPEMQTRLCAGYTTNNPLGTCPGDSGGPLVAEKSPGHYVQVGLLSFGSTISGTFPSAFTRVTHYIDWIQQTIANN